MLMFLSVERKILNFYRVYNYNNDGDKIDINISLTSNSVTEWVDNLITITSYQRS